MFSIKYLKWFFLVGMFALIATACAPGTTAGQATTTEATVDKGSITVIGQGQSFGEPNEANIQIGVEVFAKEVNDATRENDEKMNAIVSTLKEMGVEAKDIQTSNYSLWGEQFYGENGPEGIIGYRVTNQISVKIRDISRIGAILTTATNAGANSIYGVSFAVSDPDSLILEAREKAIEDAYERAQSLAELNGVDLGDVYVVTEAVGYPVTPMYGGGGGGAYFETANTSVSSGQLSYHVEVQVTYHIK